MNSKNKNSSVCTGIFNLDSFICGGYPVSALTLIEEDEFAVLSNLLLNCTISNHLCDSREVLVSLPAKVNINSFLKNLPQRTKLQKFDKNDEQSMKIAWRYCNLPDLDETSKNIDNYRFELKNKINDELIQDKKMEINLTICTHDELLNRLESVNDKLVVIRNYATIQHDISDKKFCMFLFKLKSLSRLNKHCLILSVNSDYFTLLTRQLLINTVDCALQIERIMEKSIYRDEYLGLIKINKLPKINSLNYQTTSETLDIGIQLKKNKYLSVDKFFIPPELSDDTSRTCTLAKIEF